jgi:hypothetical protein
MKKTLILLALIGCTRKEVDPYHPTRPAEIPSTTCDGTPIEWNWEKQRAYADGKLFLAKDSTGCVIALIKKVK